MPVSLGLVGLVVEDMGESLRFYRRLGLPVPEGADDEPHVEVRSDGLTFFWDAKELVRSFGPGWEEPSGGRRVVLEFPCEGPEDVDARYSELTASGYRGHLPPFDAPWGPATPSSTTRTAIR